MRVAQRAGFLPGAKAPFAFDIGKVIFDSHPIETGAEIQVKTGHIELSRHEFFGRDISQAVDHFPVFIRQVRGDGTVELTAQL